VFAHLQAYAILPKILKIAIDCWLLSVIISLMKIFLALDGALKSPFDEVANIYIHRLTKLSDFEALFIKSNFEDKLLKLKEKHKAKLVLLDETGEELNSRQLANFLEKHESASQSLIFAVGAADGHSSSLKSKADKLISLSKLTLQHDLAFCVFAEALYRAKSINLNLPYHRD